MCFSATASFVAAGALAAIGLVSVARVGAARQAAFAATPLLFAAQQACEGMVWRVLERAPFHVASSPWERAYLLFALLVWPVHVPLSLWMMEARQGRRRVLAVLVVMGGCVGAYLMGCATLRDSNACIAFGNLYYWVQIDAPLKRLLLVVYLATIALPLVVASARGTKMLAAVTVASFLTTAALYRAGFASVWCFFAAVISGVVALVSRPLHPPTRSSADPASP